MLPYYLTSTSFFFRLVLIFNSVVFLSQNYVNCRCIPSPETSVPYGSAKQGTCDRDCKNLIPFLFGAVVLLIFNFMNATPNKTVVLRWVFFWPLQKREGDWAESKFTKTSGTVPGDREKNWPIADRRVLSNHPGSSFLRQRGAFHLTELVGRIIALPLLYQSV